MNDAEPTIERLLAGLRDAEPLPGMETRMLKAMQAREIIAPLSFWDRMRSFPASAFWFASALAISVAVVAIALQQLWRVPAESSHPRTIAVSQKNPAKAVPQKVPPADQRSALRVRAKFARHSVSPPDLRAVSFPAPPLPLTTQEKMLLRIAHRRDPVDAAMLDPSLQATQAAKANEQFQQFFQINATEMRSQNE